jgi:hypothetical protein
MTLLAFFRFLRLTPFSRIFFRVSGDFCVFRGLTEAISCGQPLKTFSFSAFIHASVCLLQSASFVAGAGVLAIGTKVSSILVLRSSFGRSVKTRSDSGSRVFFAASSITCIGSAFFRKRSNQ